MDCCNYAQFGAGGWEGYAPQPYAPYHSYYAPHAHDPYARYYRLDYPPHHAHHADPHMPMDYGAYAAKEVRARRALARRDRVHPPAQHLSLPPTPPLDVATNGRGPVYGEPQMWPHYQMGVMNGGGWSGAHPGGGGWGSRGSCSREHMRYPSDCRQIKGPQVPAQNAMCQQDGKSTPYQGYDDATPSYNGENTSRHETTHHFSAVSQSESTRPHRDRFFPEPRRSPPEEKRPPVVPLPAFQQAFGSTEIGKFAEAFTRTEAAQEDASADNFLYESFTEWDGPTEPQWSTQPAAREIKCEDNY